MKNPILNLLLLFVTTRFRICRFFGILLTMSYSVVAVPIILAAYSGLNSRLFFAMLVFCLGIAASILLHELGHALGGYVVGNTAKEICLFICGGYTIFSRNPDVTAKDVVMSFAGPLANGLACGLIIWIECCQWNGSFGEWAYLLLSQVLGGNISTDELPFSFVMLNSIALVNAYMLVFNMLPAFPLDGGRIFRWFAGCFLPSQKAAFATMLVARILACLLVGWSIMTDLIVEFNPFNFCVIACVAVWIWCGSKAELGRTRLYCAAEADTCAANAGFGNRFNGEVPSKRMGIVEQLGIRPRTFVFQTYRSNPELRRRFSSITRI